jgi:hypothetical protein
VGAAARAHRLGPRDIVASGHHRSPA